MKASISAIVVLALVTTFNAASGARVKKSSSRAQSKLEKDIVTLDGNSSMLNDDPSSDGHITCPVMNALVQNRDLKTDGRDVVADNVIDSLMKAGLNQPKYKGEPLPPGSTQSNAFEYTLGIFLKNLAADYRDKDGNLALPIHHFVGTNHEHNSHTGITTKANVPFDDEVWKVLEQKADSKLSNGGRCFSRDAWKNAMYFFEARSYNGTEIITINNDVIRKDHPIYSPGAKRGASWAVAKLLNHGAGSKGNNVGGKRLVAGVSQVMNGMVNLFWTGDYGHLDLYKARAKFAETEEGKRGLSFPWLDENYCLPVDELKALLQEGKYPASSGYSAMPQDEFETEGKVWKYPKSRCSAAFFKDAVDGCVNGEPPLIPKVGWVQRAELNVLVKR